MPVRPIVLSDNPLLRKISRRVQRVSPTLQQLIDDMTETMHAANGIGLTAIQIGVPECVIIVEVPEKNEDENGENLRPGTLYAVINPKLARKSREMEDGIEGCLSIPGWIGEVSRHHAVTVKGLDPQGRPVRIKARVFQHEIDHCDGILFIDHIKDPEKIWPIPEGKEEAAEAAQETPGGAASSRLLA